MADYYPLIARAIAGLDPSAPGESRRALYERARAALIAQLRGVQPPLSESEITRERLALEEAVRKVESEAAQRARDASRASSGAARAGDALRRANNGRGGEAAPAAAAPSARRCSAAPAAAAPGAAASDDAGSATAAGSRTFARTAAPWRRQQRHGAAPRRARLPRHHRRRRRSRPRRGAGQSRRAENLRQCTVAIAGV